MSTYLEQHRCTVLRRGGDFCDAPSAEDMPFPICSHHGIQLYSRMKAIVDAAIPEADEPKPVKKKTRA